MELRIDGPDGTEDRITSTAGHPYWVVRGEDLENRPKPDHITEADAELVGQRANIPGRWVDAADIFPDDVLLLRDGREAVVWNVEFYSQPQPTGVPHGWWALGKDLILPREERIACRSVVVFLPPSSSGKHYS